MGRAKMSNRLWTRLEWVSLLFLLFNFYLTLDIRSRQTDWSVLLFDSTWACFLFAFRVGAAAAFIYGPVVWPKRMCISAYYLYILYIYIRIVIISMNWCTFFLPCHENKSAPICLLLLCNNNNNQSIAALLLPLFIQFVVAVVFILIFWESNINIYI